jgi:YHS domain-containing protein
MAKDPVCGMFVEEKPDSLRHTVDGKEYYFCAQSCLDEFTAPQKELKKLKTQVAIRIGNGKIPDMHFSFITLKEIQFFLYTFLYRVSSKNYSRNFFQIYCL